MKFEIDDYRYFLKESVRMEIDFRHTDQNLRVAPPPIEKPFDPAAERIDLVPVGDWEGIEPVSIEEAIGRRESRRRFTDKPLSLDELSFLLWATQGVRRVVGPGTALRTVPSAGARHALETYLCVFKVSGLEPGIYRYLPIEHQLLFEHTEENLQDEMSMHTLQQRFISRSAVTFIWSAIPYRMEWRYDRAAARVIAMDAGHVCQNLYLACETIGCGTCAIGAFSQDGMDQLLRLDGDDEFVLYLAPVGKI